MNVVSYIYGSTLCVCACVFSRLSLTPLRPVSAATKAVTPCTIRLIILIVFMYTFLSADDNKTCTDTLSQHLPTLLAPAFCAAVHSMHTHNDCSCPAQAV